jgi:hypothetical protein
MYKNIHLEQHQVDHYLSKPACDALQQLMANAFLECVSEDPVIKVTLSHLHPRLFPQTQFLRAIFACLVLQFNLHQNLTGVT